MATEEKIKEQLDEILIQVARTQNIENFEIHPSTEANYGDGFVGQFYTGDIRNKETGETTNVAIKKAPSWGEFDYHTIFKNEDIFYSAIFPVLNDFQKEVNVSKPFDNVPKYFWGSVEAKKEYIAMENLKPLGYVMFDKQQYWDKEHLDAIFKIYGKFHALSYVLRKKNEEKYQASFKELTGFGSKMHQLVDKPMTAAVSAAINALDPEKDKIVYDEIQDLRKNVLQTFIKADAYNGEHKCLIHGDCWSNNMLFKYSDSGELLDVKLIDFQLCGENTPIHDLSYFFYSGAAKKDLDDLDNYLKIYYKSFVEFAKELDASPEELFSFEVLKNEWKENALYGVFLGIYLWQVKLIPKKSFTDVIDTSKAQKPSMEESFKLWTVLLDNVHKTDSYKERTTAILRHAFDYGVINKDKIVRNKQ